MQWAEEGGAVIFCYRSELSKALHISYILGVEEQLVLFGVIGLVNAGGHSTLSTKLALVAVPPPRR